MSVSFKPEGIEIDGRPVVVVASSLFYFRIPRGQWRDRMIKIRQAGYNAIDVYFPWNYHELAEGKWNFRGERDVSEFLHQAAEAGLWVIARPGPYICSEWDGGGLPAFLFNKPGLRLRDNEPRYLKYVQKWFDRILPILAAFQTGRGGTVIAVQLENELDFYDCQDRAGYMEALRDMAREAGIQAPLIACAGQGDLHGASGDARGVIPTCNVYNPLADPGVEQRVFQLHERLQAHRLPLCITETNRSHFFLRRLLSAGAKLIGPYLQTGGVNFGFTNAVNNWGSPLAMLATDYDFGGMIGPGGEVNEEWREAMLFTRTVQAFGAALARAKPERLPEGALQGDLPASEEGPYALKLAGDGRLAALPNFTAQAQKARLKIDGRDFPCHSKLIIEAGRCPLLPVGVDLSLWGMPGKLAYATAELALAEQTSDGLALVFYADGAAEIGLELPEPAGLVVEGMQLFRQGEQIILCFTPGQPAAARIDYADGRVLNLYGLDRASAAVPGARLNAGGRLVVNPEPALEEVAEAAPDLKLDWQFQALERHPAELTFHPAPGGAGADKTRAPFLEEVGILRGFGWYQARVSGLGSAPVKGYLLQGAADVLSLYAEGRYIGSVSPGGGSVYLPAKETLAAPDDLALEIRAEIWGHSNFDDSRLPALRLNSPRGLAGLVAVVRERDLTSNWHVCQLNEAENRDLYTAKDFDTTNWPLVSFANWLTTVSPNQACYRKRVLIGSGPVDRWVLAFPGLTRPVEVSLNGSRFARVNPLDAFIDITTQVSAGSAIELVVYGEQDYHGQLAGSVMLLEGIASGDWQVGGMDEAHLWTGLSASLSQEQSVLAEFPVQVAPGELALLWANLPATGREAVLCFENGRNAKLSVFFNGHLVGRVWHNPGESFPRVVGGDAGRVYLPAVWQAEKENRLLVMVEAIHATEKAVVEQVKVL